MKRNVTIIAPHPDDELIGCCLLLLAEQVSNIVYIEQTSAERYSEANEVCEDFSARCFFLEGDIPRLVTILQKGGEPICVPSPEGHYLHSLVFYLAKYLCRQRELWVYSVYMKDWFIQELTQEQQSKKHKLLDQYYPSQSELWKYDAKYYLYEGLIQIIEL